MNKLLQKGVNAWLIFIKDRLAGAVMMLVSGVMMLIAALNGKGNDTKTLPSVIALFGIVFALWGFYRIGYIKSKCDHLVEREARILERKVLFRQIVESLVYIIITAVGVFLFINESFTDKILNLMAGGFTIFNGVMGTINLYKNRSEKDLFKWKFRFVLTIIEYAMGAYFIAASDSINVSMYAVMGTITTVAGTIEVITAIKTGGVKDAVRDSKGIVEALTAETTAEEE